MLESDKQGIPKTVAYFTLLSRVLKSGMPSPLRSGLNRSFQIIRLGVFSFVPLLVRLSVSWLVGLLVCCSFVQRTF